MPDEQTAVIPTCPDCGGLLHAVRAEPLTSAEVAREEGSDAMVRCQCLLCGYEELRPADEASGASALA
jgi:hypothetical protein